MVQNIPLSASTVADSSLNSSAKSQIVVLASGLVVVPTAVVWMMVEPSRSPQSVAISGMLGTTTLALSLAIAATVVLSSRNRKNPEMVLLAVASTAIVVASAGVDAMFESASTSMTTGIQSERILVSCLGLGLVALMLQPRGVAGRVVQLLIAAQVAFAFAIAAVELTARSGEPLRVTVSVFAIVLCSFMVGIAAISDGLASRRPLLTGVGVLVVLAGAARAGAPDFSYVGPGPVVLGLAGATAAAIGASMAFRDARDTSKRERFEQNLAESLERTRLSLSNDAYMARAHDQQSSLMAIEAAARQLERGDGDSDLARAVVMEAQRLQRMFDLRHRPAAGPVDIVPVLQAIVRCNQSIGVRIAYRGPSRIVAVTVGDLLAESLQSLLDNARTHGAGTALVEVKSSRDRVHVDVSDDGSGIPSALREVVFDRGVTSLPDCNTGLGLYTSRSDMRSVGADLKVVDLEDGRGFFRIELPTSWPETRSEAEPDHVVELNSRFGG